MIRDPIQNSESFCDAIGLTDSEFQKALLIMFFVRFLCIIYSLFESHCFYQIVFTLNTFSVVLKTFHDVTSIYFMMCVFNRLHLH